MDLGLRGLRAVVTGGTQGIGRSIVAVLAEEGVSVGFCARSAEAVAETEAQLREQGYDVVGDATDMGAAEDVERWIDKVGSRLGGIDVVVANASAMARGADEASWRTMFEVDLLGTVRLVQKALPFLERSDAASIVTMGSVQARELGETSAQAYGAFKAALIHYTQGLALRLAPKGIRANAISPGNTLFEGGIWSQIEQEDPKAFRAALARNPTGRMATSREIAVAVAFLASPAASFVSGTHLLVDGALTRGVQL